MAETWKNIPCGAEFQYTNDATIRVRLLTGNQTSDQQIFTEIEESEKIELNWLKSRDRRWKRLKLIDTILVSMGSYPIVAKLIFGACVLCSNDVGRSWLKTEKETLWVCNGCLKNPELD